MAKPAETYPRVRCGDCRYRSSVNGTCHRSPPQSGTVDSTATGVKIGYPIWPKVEDQDWCGEGQTTGGTKN